MQDHRIADNAFKDAAKIAQDEYDNNPKEEIEFDEESNKRKFDHNLEAQVEVETIRHDEGINMKESSEDRLVFRKFPLALWIAGAVVSVVGIYLVFHLSFGNWGKTVGTEQVQ